MHYARWAAVAAAVMSFGLVIVVAVRDVGSNVLNGWAIVLGLVGSLVPGTSGIVRGCGCRRRASHVA